VAYTDKQLRNGATGDSATQDTAQPSVDVTALVSSEISAAQAAAAERGRETAAMLSSPQGSGPSADSTVGAPARQVGSGGSMYEWDSGLAINELAGES
jgi:hypothetical protein